jgi:hypothetical protein
VREHEHDLESKEYRMVTGGEDGMIMWWNFSAPTLKVTQEPSANLLLIVKPSPLLPTIRPVHQIHLSESAQFYAIVLGPHTHLFAQNDCILSFYNVDYKSPAQL